MKQEAPQPPNPQESEGASAQVHREPSERAPLSEAALPRLSRIIQEAIVLKRRGAFIDIARHRQHHGDVIAIYTTARNHKYIIRQICEFGGPAVIDEFGQNIPLELRDLRCEDILALIDTYDTMR